MIAQEVLKIGDMISHKIRRQPNKSQTFKTIINTSTSGTNAITISPTNFRGYSTIVLNAQGETVTCLFKNSNWNVIAQHGATIS